MPSNQSIKAFVFIAVAKGAAVEAIEFLHLLQGKVAQIDPVAHIKGRLMEIADQIGVGSIRHQDRQALPVGLRIKGTLVVPGAYHPENIVFKGTVEEPVRLIDPPDNQSLYLWEDMISQKALIVLGRRALW